MDERAIASLSARGRVGEAHLRVLGAADSAAAGIVDSLERYAQEGQRLERVAPSVRAFFEQTASLALTIEPEWSWWARGYGRVWHALARRVGQLCIPVERSQIETMVTAPVATLRDRACLRAVVRRYESEPSKTMQAIAYSVLEANGEGMMSASFPLPGAVLEGILRLECIDEDDRGLCGARLTSDRRPSRASDPVGVFLHTRWGRARLPLGETLSLWDARSPRAPRALRESPDGERATVVGLHEQRLFGALLVRHRYWFSAAGPGRAALLRT